MTTYTQEAVEAIQKVALMLAPTPSALSGFHDMFSEHKKIGAKEAIQETLNAIFMGELKGDWPKPQVRQVEIKIHVKA